jgi:hypothetical protein
MLVRVFMAVRVRVLMLVRLAAVPVLVRVDVLVCVGVRMLMRCFHSCFPVPAQPRHLSPGCR